MVFFGSSMLYAKAVGHSDEAVGPLPYVRGDLIGILFILFYLPFSIKHIRIT